MFDEFVTKMAKALPYNQVTVFQGEIITSIKSKQTRKGAWSFFLLLMKAISKPLFLTISAFLVSMLVMVCISKVIAGVAEKYKHNTSSVLRVMPSLAVNDLSSNPPPTTLHMIRG